MRTFKKLQQKSSASKIVSIHNLETIWTEQIRSTMTWKEEFLTWVRKWIAWEWVKDVHEQS